jgi:hypothetical protein
MLKEALASSLKAPVKIKRLYNIIINGHFQIMPMLVMAKDKC